jgi:hypothetical protein
MSNDERALLEAKIVRLELALDQALSYGVAPSLPEPPPEWFKEEEDGEDRYERWMKAQFPYGDDTVMFFGSDECDHPYPCPELAQYLRDQATHSPTQVQEGNPA